MIVHLRGVLVGLSPLQAVVEVGGIGYAVHLPVTTMERLPSTGAEVFLHTSVVYREDDQALYGFFEAEERDFFNLLIHKVSGVGPRIALSLLSKLSLPTLRQAVAERDLKLLTQVPGIGKKSAERLCVELGDALKGPGQRVPGPAATATTPHAASAAPDAFADAVTALVTLGYSLDAADQAIRKARAALGDDAATGALIKAALR